jgi:hypothetical protein
MAHTTGVRVAARQALSAREAGLALRLLAALAPALRGAALLAAARLACLAAWAGVRRGERVAR